MSAKTRLMRCDSSVFFLGTLAYLCFLLLPAHAAESIQERYIAALNADNAQMLIQMLDDGIPVETANHTGKSAIMVAAKIGDYKLFKQLISRGADPHKANNNGGTPIMFAAISGNMDIIELLLTKNVDINALGSNGWGALMIASAKGHQVAVKRFLQYGADVNAVDIYVWTPLHRAVYENRLDVTRLLLTTATIEVEAIDDQGATPLHHAAKNGNVDIAKLLLAHGADPDKADFTGRAPSTYARSSGFAELATMLDTYNNS